MGTAISIILCTRDRARDLRFTLSSLMAMALPSETEVELIVVDNGSRDDTPAVIAAAKDQTGRLSIISAVEPEPGKSHALNRALALAHGDILLFTDDDVRPPPDWIERMTRPILDHSADAVAGGGRVPPHPQKTWRGRGQGAGRCHAGSNSLE